MSLQCDLGSFEAGLCVETGVDGRMPAEADRDEKVVLISYASPPEAPLNAVTVLKAAWNLRW